jgi:hypothetical protein
VRYAQIEAEVGNREEAEGERDRERERESHQKKKKKKKKTYVQKIYARRIMS